MAPDKQKLTQPENAQPEEVKADGFKGHWGDSEHDTVLHRTNKPHSGPPEYDPKWGYRTNE